MNVSYCILCEDVRAEILNKFSVLGFYGLLPRVNLKVQELNKAIGRLMLLVSIYGEKGDFDFQFNLLNPQGEIIKHIDMTKMSISSEGNSAAVLSIGDVIFKVAGDYTVQILYNEDELYRDSFSVGVGDATLFQKL